MNKCLIALTILLTSITSANARHIRNHHTLRHYVHNAGDSSIVSHPIGCPRSLFCGCGVSVEIFGKPIRELFLASNWYKFPRTSPAPGMVMVRNHHVALLKQHIEGSTWLVYDPNSGGHQTRLHPRSIAGYTIVDPTRS